jgi:spore coat polysaccharide biosynthesis protein SpsF
MIGCIVQARMGSVRLPNKVLMAIDQKTSVLSSVINQLKFSKKLEKILVATTSNVEDDKIEEAVKRLGIECFRGNEKNVLDRYYQCAKNFSITTVVRITCDCPLIDPYILDHIVEQFFSGDYDYASNTITRTFPDGIDVEVFSLSALEKSWKNAKLPSEKEHVTSFIKNNSDLFNLKDVKNNEDLSNLRWTVDEKEDLDLVKEIFKKIPKNPILMNNILKLFSQEPDLIKINSHIIPNEGMIKSLNEDKEFLKSQEI